MTYPDPAHPDDPMPGPTYQPQTPPAPPRPPQPPTNPAPPPSMTGPDPAPAPTGPQRPRPILPPPLLSDRYLLLADCGLRIAMAGARADWQYPADRRAA